MNKKNTNIEVEDELNVLRTIYEEVEEVVPGRYTLKLNNHYGIVDKNRQISIDTKYSYIYNREKYAVLTTKGEQGLLVLFNANRQYEINSNSNFDSRPMAEHSSLDFDIIEVVLDEDSENVSIINTNTGEIIYKYNILADKSYRPYNNYLILSIAESKDSYVGITRDFKVGKIEDLLAAYYDTVEKQKGRSIKYNCTKDGEKLVLNKYGQLY